MRHIRCALFGFLGFLASLHASEYTPGTKTHPDLLWVAQPGQLTAYSPYTGEIRHQFPLANIAWLATDPANGRVWAGVENELVLIDADGAVREPRYPMPVAASEVNAVVIDGTHRIAWLAAGNTVYRLSADLFSLIDAVSLPDPVDELALDEIGGKLFLLSNGVVSELTDAGAVALALPEFENVEYIALDRDARRLWLASGSELLALDENGAPQFTPNPHGIAPLQLLAADTAGGAWIAGTHELVHVNAEGRVTTRSLPFDDTAGGGTGNASRLRQLMPYPHDDMAWITNNKYVRRIDATGGRGDDVFTLPGSNAAIQLATSHHDITAPEIWITQPEPEIYTNDNRPNLDVVYTDYGATVATESLILALDDTPLDVICNADLQQALCIPDTEIPNGYYEFSAVIDDLAGNTSEPALLHFTVDTISPAFQDVQPVNGLVTSQKTLPVTGNVNEPAEVTVDALPVPVSAEGSFATRVVLEEGDNTIKLTAVDRASNTAHLSRDVELDTVPPAISLDNPAAAITVKKPAFTVRGSVNEEAVVKVNGAKVPLGGERKFQKALQLVEGENQIYIEATDPAGNIGRLSRSVVLDTKPPAAPDAAAIGISQIDEDGYVTIHGGAGSVEPGVSVAVIFLDYVKALFELSSPSTISNDDGSFQLRFRLPIGISLIQIVLTDEDGVHSIPITLDLSIPRAPADVPEVIPGQAGVSATGNATYGFPIDLPPGPGGFTPVLGVSYNSGAGDGILGQGWNLTTPPDITRCPSLPAMDGVRRRVHFDADDNVCLGGTRLIKGGRLGSSIHYRKELTDGSVLVGHVAAGEEFPSSFTLQMLDGTEWKYGFRPDSSLVNANGVRYRWAVEEQEYGYGNTVTYHYSKSDGRGELWLEKINYGAAHVDLQYEQRRAESIVDRYRDGVRVRLTKRLAGIFVKNDGIEYAHWNFRYLDQGIAQNEKLGSAQRCRGASCTSATLAAWRSVSSSFKQKDVMLRAAGAEKGPWLMDVTQDGLLDLVFKSPRGEFEYYTATAEGSFVHDVRFLPASLSGNAIRTGYFNDDAYVDLVVYTDSGFRVHKGVQGGFSDVLLTFYAQPDAWPADYDGDGLEDILALSDRGDSVALVFRRNVGGKMASPVDAAILPYRVSSIPILDPATGTSFAGRIVRDFNNDGRSDVLFRGFQHPDICDRYPPPPHLIPDCPNELADQFLGWILLTSEPDGATVIELSVPYGVAPVVADINGDGLADFVYRDPSNGKWSVQLNKGNGVATPFETGVTINGATSRALAIDYNRDGFDDVILPRDAGAKVLISNGNGFSGSRNAVLPAGGDIEYRIVDLNQDGLDDLLYRQANGWALHAGTGMDRERMLKLDAGLGNSIEWVYTHQSDPTVHTLVHESAAIDNLRPYTHQRRVVRELRHSDGVGGKFSHFYYFEGGAYDPKGRGFAGYASETVRDSRNGIVTRTEYHQAFPLTGRSRHIGINKDNGQALKEVTTNWQSIIDGSGDRRRYRIYPRTTESREWDLAGALLSVTRDQVLEIGADARPTHMRQSVFNGEDFASGIALVRNETKLAYPVFGCRAIPWSIKTATYRGNQPQASDWQEIVNAIDTSRRCNPSTTTRAPGTTWEQRSEFAYDAHGNLIRATRFAEGELPRTTQVDYDTSGRYPVRIRDALGAETRISWIKGLAQPQKVTEPTGVTEYTYDAAGRVGSQTSADGITLKLERAFCTSACSPSRRSVERQYRVSPDGSKVRLSERWLDGYGRPTDVRGVVQQGAGMLSSTFQYDKLGRLVAESLPHLPGETAQYRKTTYDLLGRPTMVTAPSDENDPNGNGSKTRYSYLAREVAVTDSENHVTRYDMDALGRVAEVIDATGHRTSYAYHRLGGLKTMVGPEGGTTSIAYDRYGRRTVVDDAALGNWRYQYNAFDEVTNVTDPLGRTAQQQYDKLGRLVRQTTPDGIAAWQYHLQGPGTGQLASVSGPAGDVTRYAYDTLGRLSRQSLDFDGELHVYDYKYDSLSRLSRMTYPATVGINGQSAGDSRFSVDYEYDALGNLTEVHETADANNVYWHNNLRDRFGRATESRLGNGLLQTAAWDRVNGLIKQLGLIDSSGNTVQGSQYTWSTGGNLTERTNTVTGVGEHFLYDALNRLRHVEDAANTGTALNSTAYHPDGRIRSRSGQPANEGNRLGIYNYDTGNPFELASADGLPAATRDAFRHDALGNAVQWRGLDIDWDSANRVTGIHNPATGDTLALTYSATGERLIKEQTLNGRYRRLERWSGLTEQLTQTLTGGGTGTTWRHRIVIEGDIKAVVIRDAGGDTTHYLHRDHLGSLTAITDQYGALEAEREYTEWGEVKAYSSTVEAGFLAVSEETYTGQEQLAFGLIHYNGRVYDPIIGQFLSADPYIANPFDPQNTNRRSYVGNSPLSRLDPTGFIMLVFQSCGNENGKYVCHASMVDAGGIYESYLFGRESTNDDGHAGGGGSGPRRQGDENNQQLREDLIDGMSDEELAKGIAKVLEQAKYESGAIGGAFTAVDIANLASSLLATTLRVGLADIRTYQATGGMHNPQPQGSTFDWRKVEWSRFGADESISAEQVMANLMNYAFGGENE